MTRAENARLRLLENRLQGIYDNVFQNAEEQNEAALQSLSEYEPPENTPEILHKTYREQAITDSGIIPKIAGDLLTAAVLCGNAIETESRALFASAYQNEARNIQRLMSAAGVFAIWRAFNPGELNELHAGQVFWRLVTPISGIDTAGLISQLAADRARGDYFFQRALARLGMTQTNADRLMREFSEGLRRGESVQQLTQRIQTATNASFSKARTIAKTECHRALSQGNYLAACQAAEETGLPYEKVWHHTAGQDDPRVQHEEMHGVSVPLEKEFELPDGTLMKYPHDPQAPAEHLVNCGCAFSTRLAGINSEQRERLRAEQAEQRAATAERRAERELDNAANFGDNDGARQQPQRLSTPEMPADGGALMEINVDANVSYDGSRHTGNVIIVDKTELFSEPNSVTQEVLSRGGINRNFYDSNGRQYKQISNHNHGNPKTHPFGRNGEHAHDYVWGSGKAPRRIIRELTAQERIEAGDML